MVGGRALEILSMLVERRGGVVPKDELLAHVWPDTQVVEAALRFQINALRKVLGETRDSRFIATLSGRGYGFVADVTFDGGAPESEHVPLDFRPTSEIVVPTARQPQTHELIGREELIDAFSQTLLADRFLTIFGVGGVGKTSIATAIAAGLADEFPGGTVFADFAPISDPQLVPTAIASLFGLGVFANDPIPGVVDYLRNKRLLIVFDNCEHVVEVAAATAERLLAALPNLSIIATSREPLRATGERFRRLLPLATPPIDIDAADIFSYPSVQLSLRRAGIDPEKTTPSDRRFLAEICRKLDGIPLAIEFAAARIPDLGMKALSELLEDALSILYRNTPDAPGRHQTMRATLDWSYRLLSGHEQELLSRLSVFSGVFSREAAVAVCLSKEGTPAELDEHFSDLIFKSMISADFSGEQERFTLNTITRNFAREKLNESGEYEQIRRRHAEYCRDVFGSKDHRSEQILADVWLEDHGFLIGDVRSALEWAHGNDEHELALTLTVATVDLWLELSLLEEYRQILERSVQLLQTSSPDPAIETRLMIIYAAILQNTEGATHRAQTAQRRALQIADAEGDEISQQRAIFGLCSACYTTGMYREGSEWAAMFESRFGERNPQVADRVVSHALLFTGKFDEAHIRAKRTYDASDAGARRTRHSGVFFDHRTILATILARTLWIKGFANQSEEIIAECVEHNIAIRHPMSACMAFTVACVPLLMMIGNDVEAQRVLTINVDWAVRNSLHQWLPGALAFRRMMEFRNGVFGSDYAREIDRLLWEVTGPVVEIAAIIGDDVTTDALIQKASRGDPCWCIAELHRAKGVRLSLKGDLDIAEQSFRKSLEISSAQGAKAFELRAATSLAKHLMDGPRRREGRDTLQRVFDSFTEGHSTRDLVSAQSLLRALS